MANQSNQTKSNGSLSTQAGGEGDIRVTKGTKATEKGPRRPTPQLKSHSSGPPTESDGFIPAHGGYQELLSYQKALVVYQATLHFCDRFIDKRSRTHDQMVQAARSGKQNILEGSQASGTSKETELKLTNVARASLEELLEDYRDFLRARHKLWENGHQGSHATSQRLRATQPHPRRQLRDLQERHRAPRPGHLRQHDDLA